MCVTCADGYANVGGTCGKLYKKTSIDSNATSINVIQRLISLDNRANVELVKLFGITHIDTVSHLSVPLLTLSIFLIC